MLFETETFDRVHWCAALVFRASRSVMQACKMELHLRESSIFEQHNSNQLRLDPVRNSSPATCAITNWMLPEGKAFWEGSMFPGTSKDSQSLHTCRNVLIVVCLQRILVCSNLSANVSFADIC
eukprot:216579-Hanusia_phi.AAC.6